MSGVSRERKTRAPGAVVGTALGVSCLLLAFSACEGRKHDPDAFSPTAPGMEDALVLEVEADEIVADASSVTEIIARIDPRATAERRTVKFSTTTGSFVGAADDSPKEKDVEAVDGEARVELRSSAKVEAAIVDARIMEGTSVLASARTTVHFVAAGPGSLTLSASPASLPADGFSRARLVARIPASSPSDRRTVRFTADGGTLVNGTGSPMTLTVEAGVDGVAQAELISGSTVGGATVRAAVVSVAGAEDSIRIDFTPVDSARIVRIGASRSSVPADGATVIRVFADIDPLLPDGSRTVTFTTTAGSFVGSATPLSTTATASASNRATVSLKADSAISTAHLTAEVSVGSDSLQLPFVRALPEAIRVQIPALTIRADSMERVMVTAHLDRSIGSVTDDTVVTYTAREPGPGGASVAMTFRNATLSTGGAAMVELYAPTGTRPGPVTIVATVEEGGTRVVGESNIEVMTP